MRLVVTGAGGQLGSSLLSTLGKQHAVVGLTHAESDISSPTAIDTIAGLYPHVVINAGAFTDVDGCEADPETAFAVNALGARNVALACARSGAAMVQISTDFVFDGTKGQPYWEFDLPNPVSTYGASKLAGEELARQILDRLYVVRTAWLYGPGGSHFVGRVLALAEQEQQLSVTTNEVGSPTMTDDLAEAVAALIGHGVYGTYHLVNEGQCSRYDFAQEIIRLAGLPQHVLKPVDRFPRPARVPAYAPLRNFVAASQLGIRLRPWRQALAAYINELGYSVRGAADPLAAEAAALPGV